MSTLLCLFPQRSPRKKPLKSHPPVRTRGQVLVIFAVALVTLLLFAGLAIDAGVIYVSYAQLKRGLDAGAVAAANTFKRGQSLNSMKASASEVLTMHNLEASAINLELKICDADGDNQRDEALNTSAPQFYARCPDTPTEAPRKLVWLQARMRTNFYFLTLIGIHDMELVTDATAEAAAVDLVLVIDTSESMGNGPGTNVSCAVGNCVPDNATNGCNLDNSCAPLKDAKGAAYSLVHNFLYAGYDQVSVVTFDSTAHIHLPLTGDMSAAESAVVSIKLHDDPPVNRLRLSWLTANLTGNPATSSYYGAFNPVNPEDRNGDGQDDDGNDCSDPDGDGWDDDPGKTPDIPWKSGRPGIPCDQDDHLDSYDWDSDGFVDATDEAITAGMVANSNPDGTLSPLSTCTGCGLRVATNILKENGRQGSLWVIILLSDGQVNLTDMGIDGHNVRSSGDTPDGSDNVRSIMPNGYCTGGFNKGFWPTMCKDPVVTTRYCIDDEATTCPFDYPATSPVVDVQWTNQVSVNYSFYSVEDYTRDIADETALTISTNSAELLGNDIAIYTIGLAVEEPGEKLLRYIANVGDDGDRENDPSCAAFSSCGNYFYATGGDDLGPIFDKIATRIYTRITD